MEAVASFGGFSRTHAAQLGTLVHLKSLIYKHSIIVLIFQGTQRKAYKYIRLVLAAGIEPTRTHSKQKGRRLYALKITKILYIRRFCGNGTTRPKRNGCIIYYCFLSSFPQAHRTAKPQRRIYGSCSTL